MKAIPPPKDLPSVLQFHLPPKSVSEDEKWKVFGYLLDGGKSDYKILRDKIDRYFLRIFMFLSTAKPMLRNFEIYTFIIVQLMIQSTHENDTLSDFWPPIPPTARMCHLSSLYEWFPYPALDWAVGGGLMTEVQVSVVDKFDGDLFVHVYRRLSNPKNISGFKNAISLFSNERYPKIKENLIDKAQILLECLNVKEPQIIRRKKPKKLVKIEKKRELKKPELKIEPEFSPLRRKHLMHEKQKLWMNTRAKK